MRKRASGGGKKGKGEEGGKERERERLFQKLSAPTGL